MHSKMAPPSKYSRERVGEVVAGEENIDMSLVNHVKEQPDILLVIRGTVTDLVNDQARGAHKTGETGIDLPGTPGCFESATELRYLFKGASVVALSFPTESGRRERRQHGVHGVADGYAHRRGREQRDGQV